MTRGVIADDGVVDDRDVNDEIADNAMQSEMPMPVRSGMPMPLPGFNLVPYRAVRIRVRRRRCIAAFALAFAAGIVGAGLLHGASAWQRRGEDERRQQLAQRLAAFEPALDEARRWQSLIAADDARRAQLTALTPRRLQLPRLLGALADASLAGVAITALRLRDRDDGAVFADVEGLAEHADAVANWATRLAAHADIERVDLAALRRLDGPMTSGRRDANASSATVLRVEPRSLAGDAGSATSAATRAAARGLNTFRVSVLLAARRAGSVSAMIAPDATNALATPASAS